ncbi:hypothetical protein [Vibrio sp. 10N.239.312.D08]|uniref:hypothetical protein n=1 Tax=Vibrio sp. 10N.239.312.D08 TaxID=3229978 RepID=UPI003553DB5F
MIASTIFDILKQSQLDDCTVQFKFVNSKPTVVVKFNVVGAKPTDSEKLQKLRQALSAPLMGQYDVSQLETLDGYIIEDLGHAVEHLGDSVSELLKEQKKAAKAPLKKTKKDATTGTGKSSAESASTAKKPESTTSNSNSSPQASEEVAQSETSDMFVGLDISEFRV